MRSARTDRHRLLGGDERERQREGGVAVGAGADRIGGLRQVVEEARGESVGERRERGAPASAFGARMARELAGEREQPRPPVRSLERPLDGALEVASSAATFSGVRCSSTTARIAAALGQVREAAKEARQQPVAVHARVPVEAPVEDRDEAPAGSAGLPARRARDRACSDTRGRRVRAARARAPRRGRG